MYFRSLGDLESILYGHWCAFEQVHGIAPSESFNTRFGAWLYRTRGVSASGGWALAVEELGTEPGEAVADVFFRLADAFWAEDA